MINSIFIEKFAETVRKGDSSFTLNDGKNNRHYYHFMEDRVGKVKYIYGFDSYYGEGDTFCSKLNSNPSLTAIEADSTIYIVDRFIFDIYGEDVSLPENIELFSNLVREKKEYVFNVIIPQFYDSLDTEGIIEEYRLDSCRKDARYAKLSLNHNIPSLSSDGYELKEKIVADDLCGFCSIYEAVIKELEENKKYWLGNKAIKEQIKKFIEDPETTEAWEEAIAEGLRKVDAKLVTAEFEVNGKKASAKISPQTIIHKLIHQDSFSSWNFDSHKQGEELEKELGVGRFSPLYGRHISKITYGRKTLYVRDKEN